MAAFSEVGGAEYLRKIARTHPQVFCALLGKVLPTQTQISGDAANPVQTVNRVEFALVDPKEQASPKATKGLLTG
jgi:hypothetical protein